MTEKRRRHVALGSLMTRQAALTVVPPYVTFFALELAIWIVRFAADGVNMTFQSVFAAHFLRAIGTLNIFAINLLLLNLMSNLLLNPSLLNLPLLNLLLNLLMNILLNIRVLHGAHFKPGGRNLTVREGADVGISSVDSEVNRIIYWLHQ